jgi:hypothetical protein
LFAAAAAGWVALAAGSARAEGPEDASADAASLNARARYNAGTKAFSEKRFVEAALEFEAAAAEKPSPVALYTAALSWEQANVPDRAADDYARALAAAGASSWTAPPLGSDRVALARERLASLEGVLGSVAVVGPPGWRVQLDTNTEVPIPALLHGSAGVHTLIARGPGKPIRRQAIVLDRAAEHSLEVGAALPVALAEDAGPTSSAPPAPRAPALRSEAPDPRRWQRPTAFMTVGVGGALLLAGAVLGSEAVGARDVYRGSPTRDGFDHAMELQTWTNVAFVAGGIAAAAGIALLLWPPARAAAQPRSQRTVPLAGPRARVVASPSGVFVGGAF